ncbi:MAG: histidine phosphatase family protein [Labilithrix sp.]|nr:histidine phosphatase family protein [Labilithrix sp.]
MSVRALSREDDDSTLIVLARHGQSTYNVERRYRGRADPPLDATGVRQVERLGEAVALFEPTAIYTSPRRRTQSTAAAVAHATGLASAVREDIDDLDYGWWTGKTPDDVEAEWPAEHGLWLNAPEKLTLPGGEAVAAAQARLWNAVLALGAAHPRQTIVAVTHDVAVRLIVCSVLAAPLASIHAIRIETASTSAIELGRSRTRLAWLNNTSHLVAPS